MSKLWVTSDNHFGHANIIEYCNRPFKSLEDMNKTMIRKWNERIKPDDEVIIIGDFCFKNTLGGKEGEGDIHKASHYRDLLNGYKTFVRGNHDRNNTLKSKIKSLVIDWGGMEIRCVHDPSEHRRGYKLTLAGHVHRLWKSMVTEDSVIVNVGVDVWDFYPVEMAEAFQEYAKAKRDCDWMKVREKENE